MAGMHLLALVSGGLGEAACSLLREPLAMVVPKPFSDPATAILCLDVKKAGSREKKKKKSIFKRRPLCPKTLRAGAC